MLIRICIAARKAPRVWHLSSVTSPTGLTRIKANDDAKALFATQRSRWIARAISCCCAPAVDRVYIDAAGALFERFASLWRSSRPSSAFHADS
jgi:hypothetical protein